MQNKHTKITHLLLDLLLNMQPIENKLKSMALKRALSLETEGHWITQSTKSEKYQNNTRKIDWPMKDIIEINPSKNADKIGPCCVNNKKN